ITAGIGAFSKAVQPSITIDGQNVPLNASGVAEYKTTVGGSGGYTKKVHISFINQATGKPDSRDYDLQYTVGSPTNITVSADKVRVLYIGLINPISITGGPKGAESITASISQGSLTNKGNGQYDAEVQTPGTATITVRTTDGKVMTSDFKVKTVPNPTPKVGGSAGGKMKINEFKSQVGLRADMGDFIFEDVKFNVVSYTLVGTGKGFEPTGPQAAENSGAYFTEASKRIIDMAKPGASIILDNIKVSGPGGTRSLPPTVFTLVP
ncbi:MAG TPA: GldM family protein, partial [Chitinophagaceae bacterium]|nr:GldM family protein [Chitinophagaceae bacterium]